MTEETNVTLSAQDLAEQYAERVTTLEDLPEANAWVAEQVKDLPEDLANEASKIAFELLVMKGVIPATQAEDTVEAPVSASEETSTEEVATQPTEENDAEKSSDEA